MEREVARYNGCFVCGPDNPIGLNLKFMADGSRCYTTFKPDRRHEGYKGILHGGIIAAILDEVMIKAVIAREVVCVTASMEVRFRAPADTRSTYRFEAEITGERGRIFEAASRALNENGLLVAESTAKYMTVPPELQDRLRQSLDP